MSLESWMREFYPVDAIAASGSPLAAAEHSLRKWRGALPDNLKKHGVLYAWHEIYSAGTSELVIEFRGNTCALCAASKNEEDKSKKLVKPNCQKCPLAIVRNGFSCDNKDEGYEDMSPYLASEDCPDIMIEWLEKTV